jgi:hypothetical protein
MKSLTGRLAFRILPIWAFLLIHGAGLGQSSTEQAKLALSRPFPAEAEAARRELLAVGPTGIALIGDAFRSEPQATHVRLAFLVDVLFSFESPKAYAVLYDLLSDSRAFVRGHIVQQLKRKKVQCAVPRLIEKLSDNAEFAQEVSTDPYRTKSILVSDAALAALSSIVGVTSDSRGLATSSRPKFEKWWERNSKRLSCSQ